METTTIVRNEMANGAASKAPLTNLSFKAVVDWVRTVTVVRAVFSKAELYATLEDGTEIKYPCITIVVKFGEKQYYDQTFIKSSGSRGLYKLCQMIGIEVLQGLNQKELLDLLSHIKNELNKPFSAGGWAGETVSQFMFAKNKSTEEKGRPIGLRKERAYSSVFLREYHFEISRKQAEAIANFEQGKYGDEFFVQTGGRSIRLTVSPIGELLNHGIPCRFIIKE